MKISVFPTRSDTNRAVQLNCAFIFVYVKSRFSRDKGNFRQCQTTELGEVIVGEVMVRRRQTQEGMIKVGILINHYANMSIQNTCTAIFQSCKNDNFQMNIFDIFLIFTQNIDCGYMLEPPPNEYPQSMFLEQK